MLLVSRVVLVVTVTLASASSAFAQCTKDTDCKGDRVCVNGTCSDPSTKPARPAEPEASLPDLATIRSHLEQRLASESQGALTLEAFEKTNGYEQELTHFYVVEWQADIRFDRQGWKPGDAIGGYWNDFQVMPAQGGFMSGSWIHFDQGARVRLTGTCTGRRTEKGWRLQELEIRSYQKLAQGSVAPKPQSDGAASAAPYHNSETANSHDLARKSGGQKRQSPAVHAVGTIASQKITVDYGAPSMRGRKIMGGVVPYGKVWRAGANEATTLNTDADLMIGDVAVPKGTYTLYTIPGEKEWTLVINKQAGQWGGTYDHEQDLGRVPMKVSILPAPVETFAITVKPTSGRQGQLELEWETTQAVVPIIVK